MVFSINRQIKLEVHLFKRPPPPPHTHVAGADVWPRLSLLSADRFTFNRVESGRTSQAAGRHPEQKVRTGQRGRRRGPARASTLSADPPPSAESCSPVSAARSRPQCHPDPAETADMYIQDPAEPPRAAPSSQHATNESLTASISGRRRERLSAAAVIRSKRRSSFWSRSIKGPNKRLRGLRRADLSFFCPLLFQISLRSH